MILEGLLAQHIVKKKNSSYIFSNIPQWLIIVPIISIATVKIKIKNGTERSRTTVAQVIRSGRWCLYFTWCLYILVYLYVHSKIIQVHYYGLNIRKNVLICLILCLLVIHLKSMCNRELLLEPISSETSLPQLNYLTTSAGNQFISSRKLLKWRYCPWSYTYTFL